MKEYYVIGTASTKLPPYGRYLENDTHYEVLFYAFDFRPHPFFSPSKELTCDYLSEFLNEVFPFLIFNFSHIFHFVLLFAHNI